MDAERYQQIQSLFLQACELKGSDLNDFLDDQCSDDKTRSAVLRLLKAERSSLDLAPQDLDELRRDALQQSDHSAAASRQQPEIPGFTIHEQTGAGGMGVVWKAVQHSTRRVVAIKTLTASHFGSDRAVLRFNREVELLASLDHPNIARVFDSGQHEGVSWFAMEFVEGVDLEAYANARQLNSDQLLQLIITIVEAVGHAHQRGILHRDLKPSNILVDQDGHPRILDFGLARAIDDASGITLSIDGQFLGTPAFMSPEQAAGNVSEVDTRSDIYTLGVICYRLLTGESPHSLDGNYLSVISRIAEHEVRPPRQSAPELNRDLEAILLKALAKDPALRYSSAGAMAQDLRSFLAGHPITARSPTFWYVTRRFLSRHRTAAAITVVILIAAVTGAALYVRDIQEERRRTQQAKDIADQNALRATLLSVRTSLQYGLSLCDRGDVRQGLMHLLHALQQVPDEQSPDDAATPGDPRAAELQDAIESNLAAWESQLWTRQLTIDHGSTTNEVRFSRDGQRLLIANEEGVQIRDAETGLRTGPVLQHATFGFPHQIWSVDESPDGTQLAMSSSGSIAQIRDRSSGRILHTLEHERFSAEQLGDEVRENEADVEAKQTDTLIDSAVRSLIGQLNVWAVRFSPDGQLVATGASDGVVCLWDASSGEIDGRPLNHGDRVAYISFSPDGKRLASASWNRTVVIWDLATRKPIGSPIDVGRNKVRSVSFSHDGTRIITACLDGTVKEWDAATGSDIGQPLQLSDGVTEVEYSIDGRSFYTLTGNGDYQSWETDTHRPLSTGGRSFGEGRAMAVNPVDGTVAVGMGTGFVRIFKPPNRPDAAVVSLAMPINAALFSADSRQVWISYVANRARAFDVSGSTPRLIHRMNTDTRLRSAAFDSQRRQLAIGTNYQAIVLDVEQLEATARLIHDRVLQSPEPVLSMDWTKDDTILLTATDNQLRAWLVADESELRRQPMETKPRAILATGDDRTAWVIAGRQLLRWNWDERTLTPVRTLHDDVLCLGVSDDHDRLLTGTQDGLVQLWNRNDLQNAVQSYRHDHPVTAVRFLDKRNLIATGTHAGGVRFWNQQTGQRIGPVYHHDRSVQSIDASDDQQQVLTGSTDRTARIWRLPQTQRRRSLAAWTDQLESATELSIDPQGNISRKTALVVE